MKRPDGHGRGGWSRDCGHPGPLRRPGLRFKLKPTATLNATQIARFPAKLPDRETNNLSGASAPPACAHRKSGITAQGERQRKEASTLVSFLPAGVLAPPRSCPRPERGGGRHRSWGVEVAAPPARGRGDLRTGRDLPRPRALSRAQGGHRTPRASGRRAPGRTPRPGARGPFRVARACQASHAPCPGSQVWVTGIDHLDPAYSHCSRVGGVSGVSGVRGVSDPLPGSWPQPSIHGQVPPAELIRNSNARPCTSASGGGGVDTRGRETRLARERARTPGPRASSPCGPAVSTATLRPPRTEVATRRGPPLRTREPALPGALRAAL